MRERQEVQEVLSPAGDRLEDWAVRRVGRSAVGGWGDKNDIPADCRPDLLPHRFSRGRSLTRPNLKQYEQRFRKAIGARLPDVQGYQGVEVATQTDHRLRTYLADELDRHRDQLGVFRNRLLRSGRVDLLDDVEFLAHRMTQLADRLRTADYTYADFFSRGPLTVEQMTRLYEIDTALIQALQDLEHLMDQMTSAVDPGLYLRDLTEVVHRIQSLFDQRTEMTGRP